MVLKGTALFTELKQQREVNKYFGSEWNRYVFAIKGKSLVSSGVCRQEVADSCSDWTEEPSVELNLGCAAQTSWDPNLGWTLCPLQTSVAQVCLLPGFILQSGLLEVPAIGLMLGVKNELKYGAKMKVSNGARSRLLQSLPLLMVFIIGNERFPPPQPSEPSPPDKRCRQE